MMKHGKMMAAMCVMALTLALGLAFATSCSGGSGGGGGATGGFGEVSPEQRMANVRVQWLDYTMGIDQVTDDQSNIPPLPTGMTLEGKGVKVCFRYISGGPGDGFASDDLLDSLDENPIVLKDRDGNTYEWLGYVGDITMEGDVNGGAFNMKMADTMPRFSIGFDVPADTDLEDLVLSTGVGDDVSLVDYTSPSYAAGDA